MPTNTKIDTTEADLLRVVPVSQREQFERYFSVKRLEQKVLICFVILNSVMTIYLSIALHFIK